MRRPGILLFSLLLLAARGVAAPPNTPVITEPGYDGEIVNPADLHMEAPNYSDPDGDAHASSDIEIWKVTPLAAAPGFTVEVVAGGFEMPVNIAFVPNPGPNPTDPLFYVTELYGTIKAVLRNGSVGTYAGASALGATPNPASLLNYNPTGA